MQSVKQLMEVDEEKAMELLKQKIAPLKLAKGPEDKLLSMFSQAFSSKSSQDKAIDWSRVQPLTDEEMFPYDQLSDPENPKEILDKLVVVKLNGGLGTTMGCTFPKSLIKVQGEMTFFDIVVEQLKAINSKYNTNIPLVLMHSFYTDHLMKPVVDKVQDLNVITFQQNKFPRIYEDTLEPVPSNPSDPESMWNPPGHGDVYHSLRDSGLLDRFISEGKKYMMVSNIDNLGSRPDLKVLNKVLSENIPYCCETTIKTPEEWKGGMPIRYGNQTILLETAQVPPDHMDDYVAISYFHCNNLWVNLETLKKALDENTLQLDVIRNHKVFEGKKVIQLEAAAGSAIKSFDRAIAIKVPRRRFMPVKSCNELLLMRSDLYLKHDGYELLLNEKRTAPGLPAVSLVGPFYQHVAEFDKHFPFPPSIYNLISLKVEGEVFFGKNITLEGKVTIRVPEGQQFHIPDGKVLKDIEITDMKQI